MPVYSGFGIELTPEQVVELAKQLPSWEQEELARTFERGRAAERLKLIMAALKDVDIDEETIRREVELVRAKRYEAWKDKAADDHR